MSYSWEYWLVRKGGWYVSNSDQWTDDRRLARRFVDIAEARKAVPMRGWRVVRVTIRPRHERLAMAERMAFLEARVKAWEPVVLAATRFVRSGMPCSPQNPLPLLISDAIKSLPGEHRLIGEHVPVQHEHRPVKE